MNSGHDRRSRKCQRLPGRAGGRLRRRVQVHSILFRLDRAGSPRIHRKQWILSAGHSDLRPSGKYLRHNHDRRRRLQITPTTSGPWKYSVLKILSDLVGASPMAAVTLDAAGNVYGTTDFGGDVSSPKCNTNGCGVVFKLTPTASSPWTKSAIYSKVARTEDIRFTPAWFWTPAAIYTEQRKKAELVAAAAAASTRSFRKPPFSASKPSTEPTTGWLPP